MNKTIQLGFARGKTGQPPCGRGKSPPLVVAPPPLPQWEACHWILSCPRAPYSTAITDSLDFQVAATPLRIQFAGVTPVPLPPGFAGGTMGAVQCAT